MLKRIHNRLGTAGLVVAIVALVVAVAGTALAAGGLTKKQEKQVVKIAKKYAGKQGPQGPAGAPGGKGDPGAKGEKGDPGAPGKAGTFNSEPLPSEETLTGFWALNEKGIEEPEIPISFPVPVEPAPSYEIVPVGAEPGEYEHCTGTSKNPIADPGFICFYVHQLNSGFAATFQSSSAEERRFGGRLQFGGQEGIAFGYGTWAVTAE
jgi:hypothetical protein